MRSPICNELPGQLGYQWINTTKTTGLSTVNLDDDHLYWQKMGKEAVRCWKELDAAHCQESSDAQLIAISFLED
ncbi:hypothetical protein B9Z55_013783 [Caenorhabditis nigoni]|uniref:Uncharacterized protein n=1 Tax=Caenorhabditis nigoni TaxID=1611254 RepID=A0A2G5U375_9PELO|nr:hypothetical protein B9Z55_013783 [Caenorhabditis nigoni]